MSAPPARDLRPLARSVMLEEGFAPDQPPAVDAEIGGMPPLESAAAITTGARDLRALLWSSIDNPESRDLDQVEYAEKLPNGDIRVLVGIADVAAYVPPGSPIDQHAAANTTSVYTGVVTFPMLPERLSADLTSLLEGADRLAVVVELTVAPDGAVRLSDIYRALVHNYAKLDYDSVSAWLAGGPPPAKLAGVDGLDGQVRLQDEAAGRLGGLRRRMGALDLETIEASVIAQDGKVVDLVVKRKGRANDLIESLMIAANTTIATFLEARGVPAIQRVVPTPGRWPRIVELAAEYGERLPEQPDVRALAAFLQQRKQADQAGFPDLSLSVVKLIGGGDYIVERPGVEIAGQFGLALRDYTHATAPNRRYVDLVIQRMIQALLANAPIPYDEAALEAIAARCNERDRAAAKVERRMRKHAAVDLMGRRVGEEFDAIVTGVSGKGTFARLVAPPVEGRIVRGERGLDVADRVRVRLAGVDPERGFIDFERA